MVRQFFKKAFGIRDGEIYISLLMQVYLFLIISVLLIVKPTVNALFLSNLGADNLPYGYLLVATTAILASYFYNNIIRKFSIKSIAIVTLVIFSFSFFVFCGLLYFSILNKWVLYFFYVNVSLFAVLTTSQFWIFANLVYNVREAKRLFGFIGAGGIAGGVVGGYLTSILAPIISNKGLLFLAALLILMCVPILQAVWKIRVKKLNNYLRKQHREANQNPSYRSSFQLITGSKHLTYLASIVGVGVIMAKLVDFQYSDFANKAIDNPEELASFFGFWFSNFNVIALILQLFLTNRILNYLGVTSTLMIMPLGIALGCLLFLTFPELWVLIIIKGIDGSFKQSISKAATELSILPIPFTIKNQAKSYIDVVIDSIATGISGFLLIFVVRKLDLSTSYITVIILLLLFVWMVLIYQLREAYFNSFRTNLQNSILSEENQKNVLSKETTVASANRILKTGSDLDILALLERLDSYRIKSLKGSIIELLDHENLKIKASAIRQLYDYDQGTAVEKVKSLIYVKDDEVVLEAMEYLMLHTDLKNSYIFNSYLDHESDYINNAALFCLAKGSTNNEKIRLKYNLESRIKSKFIELSEGDSVRDSEIGELLMTIAYSRVTAFYKIIKSHLTNSHPCLTKFAIKAAGISQEPEFLEILIDLLGNKKYRKRAIKALKNYGSDIVKTIAILDKNENILDKSRQHIPKVIEAFESQEAVNVLLNLLNSRDIVIRLQASKSLLKLKQKDPMLLFSQRRASKFIFGECNYYKNTIRAISTLKQKINDLTSGNFHNERFVNESAAREALIELLQYQLDQSLLCIFKLLSLKYDRSDMHVVYSGIVNSEKESRIQAIEFLDNLLHIKLKHTILPILEFHTLYEFPYINAPLSLKPITIKQCLVLLIKNRGRKIKLAVIDLIQYSHNSEYIKNLKLLTKHKNIEVQIAAKTAIEKLLVKE